MRLRHLVSPLIVAVVGVALAIPASAAPVDDKRAEAQRLQEQIEANGAKISAAAEAYNGAVYRAQQAQADIEAAQARIDQSRNESERLRGLVASRAASMYKQATGSAPATSSNASYDKRTEAMRERYSAAASARDDSLIDGYTRSIEELNEQQAQLETVKAAAEAESTAAKQRQKEVEALNAKQQQLLAQVKGDIERLVREEAERREAAARAEAQRAAAARTQSNAGAARSTPRAQSPAVEYPTNLPDPSPMAAVAIAFAREQLGKPYRYAAGGPDAYDCSGLTKAAYAAAGLSLPHYSGAQYAMFPKVPLDQLQPGDLVFRGPGGSQHVALYIGNGLVIDAPQTGDVVRIRSMGRVIGGVRPG